MSDHPITYNVEFKKVICIKDLSMKGVLLFKKGLTYTVEVSSHPYSDIDPSLEPSMPYSIRVKLPITDFRKIGRIHSINFNDEEMAPYFKTPDQYREDRLSDLLDKTVSDRVKTVSDHKEGI